MTGQTLFRGGQRILLLSFLCTTLFAASCLADDVRPVQIQIKEREPGAYLVQWRVPKVLPPQAIPSPVLPPGCRPEGERVSLDQPSSWLLRQVYRCPQGLAGRTIGIRFPLHNPSLTTVIRLELLSGERFAHALGPRDESWRVPEASVGPVVSWLRDSRSAVLTGIRHVGSHWVHLVFLLALVLLGGANGALRLFTTFAVGQLLAVGLTALLALCVTSFQPAQAFPLQVAEFCVALAVMFLAREALQKVSPPRRLAGLAGGAGLFHGLALTSLLTLTSTPDSSTWTGLCFLVLGMDAALLILALLVGLAGRMLRPAQALTRMRPFIAYLAGGGAVAAGLALILTQPVAEPARTFSPLLPGASQASAAGLPGSRQVVPQTITASLQSYLIVDPFEIRHEVLIRLSDLASAIDLVVSDDGHVETSRQDEVVKRLGDLVATHTELEIDGQAASGIMDRAGFMTASTTGVLPRQEPVREPLADALVGVTMVYLTDGMPDALQLSWQGYLTTVPEIPATVIDPESSYATTLTRDQPLLTWQNELMENPIPSVTSVSVQPRRLPVPLVTLGLLGIALTLFSTARRNRSRLPRIAAGRIVLALALLAVPLFQVAVALPAPLGGKISTGQARRILTGVLANVYRAFEFRDETTVYDRLAVSVTGETLTKVYLENRKALEIQERGGARARVDAVEVFAVRAIEPREDGGFDAEASWTIGGSVTHYGHRHFRQNRYDARISVVPDHAIWKIRDLEVLDQERIR